MGFSECGWFFYKCLVEIGLSMDKGVKTTYSVKFFLTW